MDRLKVVWLCHITNEKLNKHYNLDVDMCAYWMTQFIEIVDKCNIDLHVVSPNYYNNKNDVFTLDGVTYHLYKYHSGIGNLKAAFLELALTKEWAVTHAVTRIVNEISPDILHLFGAENITYSKGAVHFLGKIPVIMSFQGYIQLAESKGSFLRKWVIKRRVMVEDYILRHCPNVTFGEFEGQSKEYFEKKYNKTAPLVINFPFKTPDLDATTVDKEYDVVFWGRVTVDKGVEDLISAISIIKEQKPNVKCLILGGGSAEYRAKLDELVSNLNLNQNIIFGGFQKTNKDLFGNAAKAKVYALPTHYDALPGSIREGMYMKLPVVSYPVGDIPQLNSKKQCIMLADFLNVNDLALKIKTLLDNDELREELIANAYDEVSTTNDKDYIASQFMETYKYCLEGNMTK